MHTHSLPFSFSIVLTHSSQLRIQFSHSAYYLPPTLLSTCYLYFHSLVLTPRCSPPPSPGCLALYSVLRVGAKTGQPRGEWPSGWIIPADGEQGEAIQGPGDLGRGVSRGRALEGDGGSRLKGLLDKGVQEHRRRI
jgi:hypothetical protein